MIFIKGIWLKENDKVDGRFCVPDVVLKAYYDLRNTLGYI